MRKQNKAGTSGGAFQKSHIAESVGGIAGRATADAPYAAAGADGVRAYPVLEAFRRLGVKVTKGYALINAGELQSFMIGRCRYVHEAELTRFIQVRLNASLNEQKAQRAGKVKNAVAARARSRAENRV